MQFYLGLDDSLRPQERSAVLEHEAEDVKDEPVSREQTGDVVGI